MIEVFGFKRLLLSLKRSCLFMTSAGYCSQMEPPVLPNSPMGVCQLSVQGVVFPTWLVLLD